MSAIYDIDAAYKLGLLDGKEAQLTVLDASTYLRNRGYMVMTNKCYNKALHDSEIIGALCGKKNTVLDLISKLTELKDSVPSGKKNKYAVAIECINEIMEVGLE